MLMLNQLGNQFRQGIEILTRRIFDDIIPRMVFHGMDCNSFIACARDHDGDDSRIFGINRLEHIQPVHIGQDIINDNGIRRIGRDGLQTRCTICRCPDSKFVFPLQTPLNQTSQTAVIFNIENLHCLRYLFYRIIILPIH